MTCCRFLNTRVVNFEILYFHPISTWEWTHHKALWSNKEELKILDYTALSHFCRLKLTDEPSCSFCGAYEDTNIFHCPYFRNVCNFATKPLPSPPLSKTNKIATNPVWLISFLNQTDWWQIDAKLKLLFLGGGMWQFSWRLNFDRSDDFSFPHWKQRRGLSLLTRFKCACPRLAALRHTLSIYFHSTMGMSMWNYW